MKIFVNDYEITEQNTDRFSKHTKEGYADIDCDELIEVIGNKAIFTKMLGNSQRNYAVHDYNLKHGVDIVFKSEKQDFDRFGKVVEISKSLQAEYANYYNKWDSIKDLNPEFYYMITVHNRQRNNKTSSGGVYHRNLDRHLAKLEKLSHIHDFSLVYKLDYDETIRYGNKTIYGTTARDIANQLKIMRDKI